MDSFNGHTREKTRVKHDVAHDVHGILEVSVDLSENLNRSHSKKKKHEVLKNPHLCRHREGS